MYNTAAGLDKIPVITAKPQATGTKRKVSTPLAGLGNFSIAGIGLELPGILEELGKINGSRAPLELQKKWREHRITELSLVSETVQFSKSSVIYSKNTLIYGTRVSRDY